MASSQPFPFLFIEPEPEPRPAGPSFDAAALAARIGGQARASGARDTVLVLHTWPYRDAQSDELVAELLTRGAPVAYLHTAGSPQARLSLHLGPGDVPASVLDLPGGSLDLARVKAVWCRGPEAAIAIGPELAPGSHAFARRETLAALHGLMGVLGDALWVNPPAAVQASDDKLRQLQLARRLGFNIPRTLVTNDPGQARAFYAACGGEMIVKTFRRQAFEDERGEWLILTTRVRAPHLDALERVRLVPCMFQEAVPKDVELRVTVVGRRVLAAEIHSQQSALSQDDYRRFGLANTPYNPASLPPALEDACLKLARQYGLALAAVDLIRRPDGEYVFLEINNSPQYLWVQDLTGLPVRQAVADLLLAGPD